MLDEKYPIEEEKFIIPENESEETYQVNNFEGYTYDIKKDDRVKTPEELQNFFNEIDAICKKYDFSISHEDTQGGFTITRYDEKLARWLKAAAKDY